MQERLPYLARWCTNLCGVSDRVKMQGLSWPVQFDISCLDVNPIDTAILNLIIFYSFIPCPLRHSFLFLFLSISRRLSALFTLDDALSPKTNTFHFAHAFLYKGSVLAHSYTSLLWKFIGCSVHWRQNYAIKWICLIEFYLSNVCETFFRYCMRHRSFTRKRVWLWWWWRI